ncbi:sugar transferase [Algoriphagus sp. NBT04N3]|uniref:sugar transferase n=1 Tax=Algoriphagus sp. NBT04N3 TaxID=2705473 RepID=UPI0027149115|nr:sugar transferase [Algoriphagus sp. NBT04N3]
MIYKLGFKRLLDLLISFIALVILFPVFLTITLVLYFLNEGKPFFFQIRPGKDCKLFKVIKFKTMNDKKDKSGILLPDHKRTTKFGKILRQTSLDEIPQLINVLLGNMSLIGPRPLLTEYLELYSPTQIRRHEVRPGITGLSQVNGRNLLEWQKRFELDVYYVDHISFLLDLKILMLTVQKVFQREGASSSKSVTVEKFKGN